MKRSSLSCQSQLLFFSFIFYTLFCDVLDCWGRKFYWNRVKINFPFHFHTRCAPNHKLTLFLHITSSYCIVSCAIYVDHKVILFVHKTKYTLAEYTISPCTRVYLGFSHFLITCLYQTYTLHICWSNLHPLLR